jgi:hypothetical protein
MLLLNLTFTLKSTTEEDKKKLYDFTFPRVNCPFISSNIPASPVYGVHISQLIRYCRACALYSEFLNRSPMLTQKLLKQGSLTPRLKRSLTNSTVVITIWLTVRKPPYLKWQWIFHFIRGCFLCSITAKTFTRLDCIHDWFDVIFGVLTLLSAIFQLYHGGQF